MDTNQVMELLKNPEIRNEIKGLISESFENNIESGPKTDAQTANPGLQNNDIQVYDEKIKELIGTIDKLNEEITQLNIVINSDENKLAEMNRRLVNAEEEAELLNNQIGRYKSSYALYEQINELVSGISDSTKQNLENTFPNYSIEQIIAVGNSRDSLKNLWDYIKYKILEHDTEDTENLKRLLEYLFVIYEKINPDGEIKLFFPEEGSDFDSETEVILGSENSGTIATVLMPGYLNPRNNKIIKKAIVEVR